MPTLWVGESDVTKDGFCFQNLLEIEKGCHILCLLFQDHLIRNSYNHEI